MDLVWEELQVVDHYEEELQYEDHFVSAPVLRVLPDCLAHCLLHYPLVESGLIAFPTSYII